MAVQVTCPQCKRMMKPHCPGLKCGWTLCTYCSVRLWVKGRRWIGKEGSGGGVVWGK